MASDSYQIKNHQIIGIGGGEITKPHLPSPIRQYILDLVDKPNITITLLPQARLGSPDYDIYIKDFISAFRNPYKNYTVKINVIRLYQSDDFDIIRKKILESDIIYIAGGNTLTMLSVLKGWTIDLIIQDAYQNGVIIVGVSAGFVGLFKQCVNHSINNGKLLDGIGLLSGIGCAHYNTKPNMKSKTLDISKEDNSKIIYGVSEYTAIHFVNDKLHKGLVWNNIDKKSKSNQNKIVCIIDSFGEHLIDCKLIK